MHKTIRRRADRHAQRHQQQKHRNAAEPDYLPDLQRELVAVISKYIKINPNDIKVNLERQDNLEVLEVKIELPDHR